MGQHLPRRRGRRGLEPLPLLVQAARWTRTHARQPELQTYLEETVDEFGLRPAPAAGGHRRVGDVGRRAATSGRFTLDGGRSTSATSLVSAVGFLNVPRYPDWPGLDDFDGPKFHTARWEHHHDLSGKVVAVVGTGSTATQVVPAIQPIVKQLYVFQREPGWVMPKGERDLTDAERMPARPWRRAWTAGASGGSMEKNLWGGAMFRPGTQAQPEAPAGLPRLHRPRVRRPPRPARRGHSDVPLPRQAAGPRQHVLSRAQGGQRGAGPPRRAHVTPTGIVDTDGVERAVDVIVMATGFQPADYLARLDIVGRRGGRPSGALGGRAAGLPRHHRAGFPNLFMLYGPAPTAASSYRCSRPRPSTPCAPSSA